MRDRSAMRKAAAKPKQRLNNEGRISVISSEVANYGGILARYPCSFFNVHAETAPVSPHQTENTAGTA